MIYSSDQMSRDNLVGRGDAVPNREGWIVPVNKPAGMTSFEVIRRVRRATGVRKVGHGGTLDPFAEGVLLVGIGRGATRRLDTFLKGDKEYLARVALGIVTDTYDPTGRIVERNEFEPPDEEAIVSLLQRFEGEISQTPPPFSALKVNGVRLYKLARRGEDVKPKPRRVTLKELELQRLTADGFEIRVVCSHGTYIRSLAHDIGREIGCGAHLSRLVRTRVGEYTLDQAVELDDFLDEAVSASGGDRWK